MKQVLVRGVLGLFLGLTLSSVGFADYRELSAMLTLSDLRLVWVFVGAVTLFGLSLRFLIKTPNFSPRKLHPGIVPGSLFFGIGWAVTGACPGVVFVQIGQGQIVALITLAGIIIGSLFYRRLHNRLFNFDTGVCG